MDQLDIAIHQTAHHAPGGLPKLAKRLGIGEQVFRNKVNSHNDTHHLNVREMIAMVLATNDTQIMDALALELGGKFERHKKANNAGLIDALLTADAEHGDITREMRDALQDKSLTEREKSKIRKEISEARDSLDVLEQKVVDH